MLEQEKLLIRIAKDNIEYILRNGYAQAGHNGPHGHPDTPARNSAHMLIIYCYLSKKGHNYTEIIRILIRYLINCSKETSTGAVKCMESDKFDHLNGLIGQAWVIEALLYSYDVVKDSSVIDVSKHIFSSQKYNYHLHLWSRIEIDGTDLGYDKTYNHQCWFAASGAILLSYIDDETIHREVTDFLDHTSERDFVVDQKGRLKHLVSVAKKSKDTNQIIKYLCRKILYPLRYYNLNKLDYLMFENSYHIFDMYGFAILYSRYPSHPLFASADFKRAVSYSLNIDNINKQCGYDIFISTHGKKTFNKFYFTYNSPAFEFPYVSKIFGKDNIEINDRLLQLQYRITGFDFKERNPDPVTFTARAYELVRYLDLSQGE